MHRIAIDYSQPLCYIMVGVAGCGKSKVAQSIKNHPTMKDSVLISTDVCIQQRATERNISYQQSFLSFSRPAFTRHVQREIHKAVKGNKSIIVDRCNLTRKSRKKVIDIIPDHYNVIMVLMTWDDLEIIRHARSGSDKSKKNIPIENLVFMCECFEYPEPNEYDVLVKQDAIYT